MLPALRILRTIHASLVGMARHHPGIAMLLKDRKKTSRSWSRVTIFRSIGFPVQTEWR